MAQKNKSVGLRMKHGVRKFLLFLLAAFVFALPIFAADTINAEITARNGMVASAQPLASAAGLEILMAGGNAIDAAIAAAFALGVVEPNATGLGGEGMMVIYLAENKTTIAIDYRSMAPLADMSKIKFGSEGHVAVAVPGTVAGLCTALKDYGTKSLAEVMAPAIRYARNGFIVSETLAQTIADRFDPISRNEALLQILAPEGLPLQTGDIFKNPDLAVTLEKIAAGGPDVFYKGDIADAIAQDMAKNGGFITKADLAAYRAIKREPVRGTYRGYEIVSAPPPVGGISVIEMLNMLECFDIASEQPLSPRNIHIMAEVMKRGFADNSAYVGDPDFFQIPVTGLLDKEYARSRVQEIDLNKVTTSIKAGTPDEHPSTTHLSVVDRHGNMVALTQTISGFWGACVAVPGTGIILNNEMQNWSSRGPNSYAPGKRMRTTIAPTIIAKDGNPFVTMGTPGAGRIISTMVILTVNLIDFDMGVQEAIESPRFYARDTEKLLSLESRIPKETQEWLKSIGYSIKEYPPFDLFFGGAQAILVDPKTGIMHGGADPRRDGAVFGF
ncbi:MAG TPA: gamma-glutamyltransferase [Rectinema sp.]|nr:MAG: Gamma-glutamyltranspeptidase precursor [Spirochaetes bacterium ADurb.Bin001]HNT60189.1 gamma-glutamyltransferase [Rectinema sp.]HPN92737.1 gamma-glutamyltransferase [Rectinema sp.]HQN03689.1 gamma-glutamyltransferase [Rectinema sp.]